MAPLDKKLSVLQEIYTCTSDTIDFSFVSKSIGKCCSVMILTNFPSFNRDFTLYFERAFLIKCGSRVAILFF